MFRPHPDAPGEMPIEEFRKAGHEIVDWIADYLAHPERHPVESRPEPGALADALPQAAPEHGEAIADILRDFDQQIVPNTVHWNHPGFLAYFAASGSAPGVLADALISATNNIGLLWKASPALTEVEQVTMAWLRDACAFPGDWFGWVMDSASAATLHAVVAARQAAIEADRTAGKTVDLSRHVMYISEHAHMSAEKPIIALGLSRENCRKIPAGGEFAMRPEALRKAIERDLAEGYRPFCVTATIGTTSTTAIDPVPAVAEIAEEFGLWLHVDAAYAGVTALCPEFRPYFAGCERADSYLVNPHKWLFVPMELTAFYTRRPEHFRETFSQTPEYLRNQQDPRAVNFMEYGIPLGRRFRALKLWFVMRYFGLEGLRANLREHCRLARWFAEKVAAHSDLELFAPVPFSLVCFRWSRPGMEEGDIEGANQKLLESINASGEFLLSGSKIDGRYFLRVAIGNLRTTQTHIERLWALTLEGSSEL